MKPICVEYVGGPRDGEHVWYDGEVPSMVELQLEDRVEPAFPWKPHGDLPFVVYDPHQKPTSIRVVRYVRTAFARLTHWPKGKPRPKIRKGGVE